jgi:hypothetical protein
MRHPGSPGHRCAATISLLLMILNFLMLVEAISADRDEVLRFAMVLASGATTMVKLVGRMTVLVE